MNKKAYKKRVKELRDSNRALVKLWGRDKFALNMACSMIVKDSGTIDHTPDNVARMVEALRDFVGVLGPFGVNCDE